MSEFKISKRYAAAFLELGKEKKKLSSFENDMKLVLAALNSSNDLQNFLLNPVNSEAVKIQAIKSIFSKIDPFSQNFLELIIKKKRENYLQDILQVFFELVDIENGLVRAQVKAPIEITAELKSKLESGLKAKTGKNVVLSTKLDPSLKGGVVVQVNDTVYDASIKHQLGILKTKFLLQN